MISLWTLVLSLDLLLIRQSIVQSDMRYTVAVLFCLTLRFGSLNSWIVRPGPKVIATKGQVWPKPQSQEQYDSYYVLEDSVFNFNVTSESCAILDEAVRRYTSIIFRQNYFVRRKKSLCSTTAGFLGSLQTLDVELPTTCLYDNYPSVDMDEEYNLTVSKSFSDRSVLSATSVWGILRGLETFSQLVYLGDDDLTLVINATTIHDFPRFSHRGLLLDTSRHYLPYGTILNMLDAMTYNKMNVLHWHIVDDQSFPYQSTLYPELSDKGAYHPQKMVYSPSHIKAVITRARMNGIRVIPEFDMPGHTRSWGEGVPELLTSCYDENGTVTNDFGPMNPSRPFLFSFLDTFFDEIRNVFPDDFVHIGGDEVPFDCWESNADLNNFMKSINITGDYKALQSYFTGRLLDIVSKKNFTSIVWEEVFLTDPQIPDDTVVQVWLGGYDSLRKVTASGKRALLSSCWYLDRLTTGGDWTKFYDCDPEDFGGDSDQLKLILGGEACMWGEVVDRHNVLSRTWPRASAVAEKLWSAHKADTYERAQRRLEEHVCRMNRRGIPAQPPNGPGFCLEF